jgi:hypothetical protein
MPQVQRAFGDRLSRRLGPIAGGTKLTFAFRPRYGLKAKTAPSLLYDYYNPDARVVLPPADFVVQRPQPEVGQAVAVK